MKANRRMKAIFFDLDGTLLSFQQHAVPESARKALEIARQQGALLFAATGRHMSSIRENRHLQTIAFTGYVTMNGQYCVAGETVVHRHPLHREDVDLMIRYLEQHPMSCMFQGAERTYLNREEGLVLRTLGGSALEIRDPRTIDETLYQLCVLSPDGHIPSVLQEMRYSKCTKWHSMGMDIIPSNGNKWVGIQRILAHYGITPEETVAFGDGENDIEMLTGAGFSVAMGNAPDHVKAAADYITDDVDNDGVYKAMLEIYRDAVVL